MPDARPRLGGGRRDASEALFPSRTALFIEENAQYQIAQAEALGGAKPFPKEIWDGIAAQRRMPTGGTNLLWAYWEQIVEEQGLPL